MLWEVSISFWLKVCNPFCVCGSRIVVCCLGSGALSESDVVSGSDGNVRPVMRVVRCRVYG